MPPSSARSARAWSVGDDPSSLPTLAVVLASAGRPQILAQALATCENQRGVEFTGVVSVPDEASLPDDRTLLANWRVVMGPRGAAAQRNTAIDALDEGIEIVAFFDDDAVLRDDYLARATQFLQEHPDVVGLTGRVLMDGARSGEINEDTAAATLRQSTTVAPAGEWQRIRSLYGCNFVVRLAPTLATRFDDRLPLYSWLEDHDFARRLQRVGGLARVEDCVVVHRAAASGGRTAHRRLGYSQVMNPVYLAKKGSFSTGLAAQQIFRPVAKNLALSIGGPAVGWRRERLGGNVLALSDVLRMRIRPERVLDI